MSDKRIAPTTILNKNASDILGTNSQISNIKDPLQTESLCTLCLPECLRLAAVVVVVVDNVVVLVLH